MTSLGYVLLYVPDVEAAVKFYEAATDLKRSMVTPGGEYGEMVNPEGEACSAKLAFVALKEVTGRRGLEAAPPSPCFEVALVTADVAAAYEKAVKAGAVAVKGPEPKPWGQEIAYVKDPNGFLVEFCTPVKAE